MSHPLKVVAISGGLQRPSRTLALQARIALAVELERVLATP